MNHESYPELHDHLRGLMKKLAKEASGPRGAFAQLHQKSLADGALDTKMGGGPASVYGTMANEGLDQFQQAGVGPPRVAASGG